MCKFGGEGGGILADKGDSKKETGFGGLGRTGGGFFVGEETKVYAVGFGEEVGKEGVEPLEGKAEEELVRGTVVAMGGRGGLAHIVVVVVIVIVIVVEIFIFFKYPLHISL